MSETSLPEKKSPNMFMTTFLAVLLAIILGAVFVKWYFFPSAFSPTSLNEKEKVTLNQKLKYFGIDLEDENKNEKNAEQTIQPESYQEDPEKREVRFSEKEINSLIAKNPTWATRLAIDFSDNLASAKMLIPLDPDLPILGGKTMRINTGVEVEFQQGRPSLKLQGVSVWGVPLPNAWLGNIKNIDLIEQYGGQEGFWKSFADGITYIKVTDGHLVVKLNE